MRYDVTEYTRDELEEMLRKRDAAKEFMEAILEALYSKEPISDLFEHWVEELAYYHDMNLPKGELQIERKNNTLKDIQFYLQKVI